MRTQFEKIKTFMNLPQSHLIAAFVPWIFFSIMRPTSLLIASIGAILLMGLFNFRELRKGFIMPWGSIVVFTLLAILEAGRLVNFGDLQIRFLAASSY